ncbi:MAG: redox-sensing transcriptional repressor Rex [Gemmatimonadota bacterium]
MTTRRIPDSTVRRLSLYLRLLRELDAAGDGAVVSSRELAERSGTTSAQVRKDLSLFGSFGKRGSGYRAAALAAALEGILGLKRRWRVGLVGVGKIGSALLGYGDLEARGFDLVAAFDSNPRKVGREVFGTMVFPVADLPRVVVREAVSMGIIATPPEAAQETAERLVDAGVSGILNFAPTKLDVPSRVTVRTMDVALELEGLSFDLTAAGRAAGRDS